MNSAFFLQVISYYTEAVLLFSKVVDTCLSRIILPTIVAEKKGQFRWKEALLEIWKLLDTGRKPEEEPPPQKRRVKRPPEAAVRQSAVRGRPLCPLDFSFTGMETFGTRSSLLTASSQSQPLPPYLSTIFIRLISPRYIFLVLSYQVS